MNTLLASILVSTEIFISIFGLYLIFRKNKQSISLSLCYSIILVLAIYSLSIQLFFLLNLEKYFFLFDIAISVYFLIQIQKNRQELLHTIQRLKRFYLTYRLYTITLSLILGYLFLQAFLMPPVNFDSMVYNLARVLMFQNEGTLFLSNYTSEAQVVFPMGFDILSFLHLRFYSDFGLGLFSFLSYITIIIGTYSLVSKMFQNEKLGVKTAFIIASLTELVLQATSTKNDIPTAAIAVVCFLSSYSFLKTRRFFHLYVTITACLWGLSVKGYFLGFVLPFGILFLWLLAKEIPVAEISKTLFQKRNINYSLLLPVGLLFCVSIFYGNNLLKFGNVFGPRNYVVHHLNQDGLYGGALNAGKYFLQFTDFPKPIMQNSLNKIHTGIFGKNNQRGVADKTVPVDLSGKPTLSEDYSWYGPLGILLVFPAILVSCFSRRRFLRLVAFSLLGFMFILSYRIAWTPWSNRFFSLFFAGSGVCVAFILNKYVRYKWTHFLIITISFLTIFSAALLNQSKPSIKGKKIASSSKYMYQIAQELIEDKPISSPIYFPWLLYLSNRDSYYKNYFGESAFKQYSESIEKNQNVLLIGRHNWIFPFLFTRPDLNFTVAKPHKVLLGNTQYDMNKKADFRFLRDRYDYILISGEQPPGLQLDTYLENEQNIFSSGTGKKHLSLYRIK
jgi:hypothetical protein